MNLLSSATVFSFFTLISRFLGYIRDILIAFFLGASIYADAFFVAFRLPNTFRRLFAEGTFNAAFIPSYTKEKIKGSLNGKKFADDVLFLLIVTLLAIIFIVEIFTPYVIFLIAPGFVENDLKYNLAIEFSRITFPFLLFVSISSFFSGILNANNKFAAAAAAPIILNIILIITLFVSYISDSDYAKNLSYGVSLSGFIQMIFLAYYSKKYYKPKFYILRKIEKRVKFFLKKLAPSIFSSGVTQINILVGTIIASFEAGAVSYLYYADRVYQINLAIAGIAVGIVSLPILSKAIKKRKNDNQISKIQNKSIELTLLLSLPASLGLILASEEIISALFGYGSFSEQDTKITAAALYYFGFGVPAFALTKVLANFYFARDNTKTPFYISALIVAVNIIISLSFFEKMGFIIIPIATTISTWIGTGIYFILLNKKRFFYFSSETLGNIFKIILSVTIMSILLYFGLIYFEEKLNYINLFKVVYLLSGIIFLAIIYLISCNLLGVLKIKNYKII